MFYDSEAIYVNSKTDALSKIAAIDNIIGGLLTTAMAAVGNADMQTYQLNDGQTEIKMNYRSLTEITQAIKDWRSIKALYAGDINNRVVRMMDAKNLYIKNFGR